MDQLKSYLRSQWKEHMTQLDIDNLVREVQILDDTVTLEYVMRLIEEIGQEQLQILRQIKEVDFDESLPSKLVPSNKYVVIAHKMDETEYKRTTTYNIVLTEKMEIPANDYLFFLNPHDDPAFRKRNDMYDIYEQMNSILFEKIDDDGKKELVTLDIRDEGCFQPTVLVDADYPEQAFFTLRNNTDSPCEIKSLAIKSTSIIKSLVPPVCLDSSYRVPTIICQKCERGDILANIKDPLIVRGLIRASTQAAGLDLKTDEFVIQPRGVVIKNLVGFFKYRETENSPHQFILRSRMSRNGMSININSETVNDESHLQLIITNNSDKLMRVPDRFLQYIPPISIPINNGLIHCQDPNAHCFFTTRTKKRSPKIIF